METNRPPLLRILECPELLTRMWPAERWLLGMKTCKGMRKDLAEGGKVSLEVALKKHDELIHIGPAVLQAFMSRFDRCSSISIRAGAPRKGCVIVPEDAVVAALESIARPSYVAEGLTAAALAAWARVIPKAFSETMISALEVSIPSHLSHNLVHLNLSALSLGCDAVRKLAAGLGQCTVLQRLELSNNKIGENGATQLAECLSRCVALSLLDLSFNAIRTGVRPIAEALGQCLELTSLSLRANALIPGALESMRALSSCRKLSCLELAYNRLSPAQNNSAFDFLSASISSLNLRNTGLPPGCHFTSLRHCTSLTFLQICDNNLRHDGIMSLVPIVSRLMALRHLDISNSCCTSHALGPLSQSLASCTGLVSLKLAGTLLMGAVPLDSRLTSLTSLDLSDNEHMAMDSVSSVVERNTNLADLKITNCNELGSDARKLARFAEALLRCPDLRSLDLEGNAVTDEGVRLLSLGALAQLSRLTSLDLSNTSVGLDGVPHVCAALWSSAACLEQLLLGCWKHDDRARVRLGPEGTTRLAATLPACARLAFLDLEGALMGDAGASALGGALGALSALERLELANNGVGPAGLHGLRAALATLSALARLNLGSNPLGDEGVRLLAASLPACTALRVLSLAEVGAGDTAAASLAEVIGQCGALATLELSENAFGAAGVAQVVAALPQCGCLTSVLFQRTAAPSQQAAAALHALHVGARVVLTVEEEEGWGEEEEEEEGVGEAEEEV